MTDNVRPMPHRLYFPYNFHFWKFWRNAQIGQNSSLTSHDSRGFQLSPNGPKLEKRWYGES